MKLLIKDFPKYSITDDGVVWHNAKQRPLKGVLNSYGYFIVSLYSTKKEQRSEYPHILVAKYFIGPKPDKHEVNHKNGIKTDNRLENLEYVTGSENMKHAYRLGLQKPTKGSECSWAKLTEAEVLRIRSGEFAGWKQEDIGKLFNASQERISSILLRKSWKHI